MDLAEIRARTEKRGRLLLAAAAVVREVRVLVEEVELLATGELVPGEPSRADPLAQRPWAQIKHVRARLDAYEEALGPPDGKE